MKMYFHKTTFIAFFALFCLFSAKTNAKHSHKTVEKDPHFFFVENKNQWEDHILYRAELPNTRLYLEKDRFTYLLLNDDDMAHIHDCHHNPAACENESMKVNAHAFQVIFEQANLKNNTQASCKAAHYRNYFIGNDEKKWAGDVGLFQEVSYENMYDDIEMRIYSTEEHLKYDFIAAKNADVTKIVWNYKGVDDLKVDEEGNLHAVTSVNTLIEQKPYAFQYINGKEIPVICHFKLLGNNRVTFEFPNGYDKNEELIIDPTLVFSTFSGSSADNWGFTATYDNEGHFYAGGAAFGFGYPTTLGAFDTSFGGNNTFDFVTDIAITKFTPAGNSLVYSTYLGGSGTDLPHSLIVTPNNELVILGSSSSTNYPTTNNAYDTNFNGGSSVLVSNISFENGSDIVVTKMSANGSALVGSTYLGGNQNDGLNLANNLTYNYADEARGEVFLDSGGNIYIASSTLSSNFPTTAGAFQTVYGSNQDGCITKFNSNLSQIVWSSFIGGNGQDAAYSLKLDGAGNLYVCGGTTSSNFPTTAGSIKPNYGGSVDGFLAKINNNGTSILNSTFLGTFDYDQSYFVELDDENNVFVVGQTSGNYPVFGDVYSNSNSGQFIHKMTNDLSTTLLSTVFGRGDGNPDISPTAFLVDICNNVYVSGWGSNLESATFDQNLTTSGLPTTADAFQSGTDGNDFYFIVFQEDLVDLEYATFFGGGSSSEHVDGGTSRFDKQGNIYQAVCAGCGGSNSFPISAGAWSSSNNSENCNFGAIKFAFDPPLAIADADADPVLVGCVPFDVQFFNNSINATEYQWDFFDNTTSTEFEPSHSFQNTGIYYVQLIASDPDACNIADTTYVTVLALNPDEVTAEFEYEVICETVGIYFDAQTWPGILHAWDFGDGTFSTQSDPYHVFPAAGETYTVTLHVYSEAPDCFADQTYSTDIFIPENVTSAPVSDVVFGCIPVSVNFSNNSTNATNFEWDFGVNGEISTEENASFTFLEAGDYEVTLTAFNPESCNEQDISTVLVSALDTIIIAEFNYILPPICDEQNVVFETDYPEFTEYQWNFGDGNSSTEANPNHIYSTFGTYEVSLIVSSFCSPPDSISYEIVLEEPPLVDGEITLFPQNGCMPLSIEVAGEGNAVSYLWNFGDGTTAEGLTATHTYETAGTYGISFTAIDSSTCNISLTQNTSVEVYQTAIAAFEMSSNVTEASVTPTFFTNNSQFADSYLWDFGDGNTSEEENPTHLYETTGTFEVCLQAINEENCNDEVCQTITVLPQIYIGVPTAFSPNSDQLNDILFVEGRHNIDFMLFRIFNRWGEMVFETKDPNEGWNGIYKDLEQETEVYVFTLVANLVSGRQVTEQGNVTLLR